MSIKKSLFAVAATALAMLAFAASAMAVTEDKLVDTSNGETIPAGRELHLIGWASFVDGSGNGMKCHVTAIVVTTGTAGTTGHVKTFTPTTTACTGSGFFAFQGCNELTSHSTTNTNAGGESIWDVTSTENDFDVTNTEAGQSLVIHFKAKGSCVLQGQEVTVTFPSITLRPLKTGTNVVTNTSNLLGSTAATGESIAGVEISGNGTSSILGGVAVTANGELELTSGDRCTWKFAAA